MKLLLNACNRGQGVAAFRKKINVRDAVWVLAYAWDSIP